MASVGIPKHQRAAVREGSGESATAPVKQIDVPEPGPGQILVRINWTGLCASDKSLIHDEWAGFGVAMMDATKGIAGHEGKLAPWLTTVAERFQVLVMSSPWALAWRRGGRSEIALVSNGLPRPVGSASSA